MNTILTFVDGSLVFGNISLICLVINNDYFGNVGCSIPNDN